MLHRLRTDDEVPKDVVGILGEEGIEVEDADEPVPDGNQQPDGRRQERGGAGDAAPWPIGAGSIRQTAEPNLRLTRPRCEDDRKRRGPEIEQPGQRRDDESDAPGAGDRER
jgi:hypothetical protein